MVAPGSTVSAVAGEHEDFDVEAWDRRFFESPSTPVVRPQVRTRRPDPEPVPEPFEIEDLLGGHTGAADAIAEEGFPAFEHGQWTVEGEIERFGAFGRGAAHARGWKRGVAFFLLALIVLPLLIEAVQLASRLVS